MLLYLYSHVHFNKWEQLEINGEKLAPFEANNVSLSSHNLRVRNSSQIPA